MSNDWEFSTVGQRDRLKLIRSGRNDVYSTEKSKNETLRKNMIEAGLPTDEIDNWDALIDHAHAKASANKSDGFDRSVLPTFMSKSEKEALRSLNKLKKASQDAADRAFENAVSSSDYLAEYLANNGYSDEGKRAKTERGEIVNGLADILDEISEKYSLLNKSDREKYLSRLRKHMR